MAPERAVRSDPLTRRERHVHPRRSSDDTGDISWSRASGERRVYSNKPPGLFYVSPVLLVAVAGAWIMFRQGTMRRELVMILSIFAILLASNASFNGWEGGNAFGPRYLLVVIPLMGIPLLFACTRWRSRWRSFWQSHEATWASFNLGELFSGPGTRKSIVPITLWILAGSALLGWQARRLDQMPQL